VSPADAVARIAENSVHGAQNALKVMA
jgi:hypothetical protein